MHGLNEFHNFIGDDVRVVFRREVFPTRNKPERRIQIVGELSAVFHLLELVGFAPDEPGGHAERGKSAGD